MPVEPKPTPEPFIDELRELLNRRSMENASGTPDYILAKFMCDCLEAFDFATRMRDSHKGIVERYVR